MRTMNQTIVEGEIFVRDMEITANVPHLKAALESPVTQTSVINIQRDKVAEFLVTYKGNVKLLHDEYHKPYCVTHSYQDPCLFIAPQLTTGFRSMLLSDGILSRSIGIL
jgi:hypothetical protein